MMVSLLVMLLSCADHIIDVTAEFIFIDAWSSASCILSTSKRLSTHGPSTHRAGAAGRAIYQFDRAPILKCFVSRVIPGAADHGVSGKKIYTTKSSSGPKKWPFALLTMRCAVLQ
ncbi:hypothetical protein EDD22DRAFT_340313 [Suillus occidentalis]|nr:hypothetical protein EDD22DRAFT_340313 [Suillus occidentalis]